MAEPLRSTDIEAPPAAGALSETAPVPHPVPGTPPSHSEGAERSRFGVLRHRHFRNVWAGALVSNVGGWMETVGVQWIVAEMTGSALLLAWLAAAQLGPMLVLGLVGGLAADRLNRKKLLLTTQAILMAIAAALMAATWLSSNHPHPAVLLALSLAQGVTLAFNFPAWQVLTPRLVPREELTAAIALNGLQFNLARIVGPALAGAVMAAWGPTWLFAANTVSFLFVLLAVSRTPDSPAPPADPRSMTARTLEAISFVFHRRGPRAVFLATVTFAFFAAPLMRLMPLFAKDVYSAHDPLTRLILSLPFAATEARETIFGWLLTVMGAGAVTGVIGLRWVPRWYPKHHFIPLSILLGAFSIAAFSATRSLTIASIALFFGGAFWLWAFNSSMAALQLLVPDGMRGRVMSINNMAVFGAMPAGAFAASLLGELHSDPARATQLGVGAMGAALAVAGLVMLIWRTPEVDGLQPGQSGYDQRPGLLRGITGAAHRPRAR